MGETPYPPTSVKFATDSIYFIAKGNVTFTVYGNMSESKTLHEGDTVWIKAGTLQSGFVPVDNQKGTIVTPLYKPYAPRIVSEPFMFPPAPAPTNASSLHGDHRFYLATDLTPP